MVVLFMVLVYFFYWKNLLDDQDFHATPFVFFWDSGGKPHPIGKEEVIGTVLDMNMWKPGFLVKKIHRRLNILKK